MQCLRCAVLQGLEQARLGAEGLSLLPHCSTLLEIFATAPFRCPPACRSKSETWSKRRGLSQLFAVEEAHEVRSAHALCPSVPFRLPLECGRLSFLPTGRSWGGEALPAWLANRTHRRALAGHPCSHTLLAPARPSRNLPCRLLCLMRRRRTKSSQSSSCHRRSMRTREAATAVPRGASGGAPGAAAAGRAGP